MAPASPGEEPRKKVALVEIVQRRLLSSRYPTEDFRHIELRKAAGLIGRIPFDHRLARLRIEQIVGVTSVWAGIDRELKGTATQSAGCVGLDRPNSFEKSTTLNAARENTLPTPPTRTAASTKSIICQAGRRRECGLMGRMAIPHFFISLVHYTLRLTETPRGDKWLGSKSGCGRDARFAAPRTARPSRKVRYTVPHPKAGRPAACNSMD